MLSAQRQKGKRDAFAINTGAQMTHLEAGLVFQDDDWLVWIITYEQLPTLFAP